jgi:hypothetical protein
MRRIRLNRGIDLPLHITTIATVAAFASIATATWSADAGYKGVPWGSSRAIARLKLPPVKQGVSEAACAKLGDKDGVALADYVTKFLWERDLFVGLNLSPAIFDAKAMHWKFRQQFTTAKVGFGCGVFYKNGLVAVIVTPSDLSAEEITSSLTEKYGPLSPHREPTFFGERVRLRYIELADTLVLYYTEKQKTGDNPQVLFLARDQNKMAADYFNLMRRARETVLKVQEKQKMSALDSL